MKKAIIIGVAGQDGAYLAQHLLQIGYEVIGLHRFLELNNLWRLQQLGILNHIQVLHFDLNNPSTLRKILLHHRPDELYNLGGITSVAESFRNPNWCYQINALATAQILDILTQINITVKYFHAASSEMFGANPASNLDENSTFHPVSPYGISKVFAYHNTSLYRHNYGLPIGVGIAFNHESPLRGPAFFSAKIIKHVQQLNGEKDSILEVGNTSVSRDWGYAPEYVLGMHAILNEEVPQDYIMATGTAHTIKDFISMAFETVGYPIVWEGEGLNEVAHFQHNSQMAVRVNPKFYRPTEAFYGKGNPQKAFDRLGWKANTNFSSLIQKMIGEHPTKYHQNNAL